MIILFLKRPSRNQMGSDAIHRTETSFGLDGDTFNLLDMASAYGIFAAQGVRYGQPGLITVLRVEAQDHSVWLDQSNPQAQPVTTPQLAYLINNILSDEVARWPSLGHPNSSEIGKTAAMKYGQTDDGHDLWTIGYTPARLVTVWTATRASDSPRLSPQLSIGLWSALMQTASQSLPSEGWSIPAGITTMDVCDPSGLLPTKECPSIVSEVFLNGNEPVQLDNLYQTFTVESRDWISGNGVHAARTGREQSVYDVSTGGTRLGKIRQCADGAYRV